MPKPTRPLVYISYRWRGAKQHSDRLVRELSRELPDFEVFQDSVSLQPGSPWGTALQEALSRAKLLLVLIDPDWLKHDDDFGRRRIDDSADWVRLELERSFEAGRPVLPVLLEGARMPPAEALPEPLRPLTELFAAQLRVDQFDEDTQIIAKAIRDTLGQRSRDKKPDQRHRCKTSRAPRQSSLVDAPLRVLELEISDFRGIEHAAITLDDKSSLPGDWTCIAGINGAGKSSLLQALSLLLMGPGKARELGGRRLASFRRRTGKETTHDSRLKARVIHLGDELTLEMTLTADGPRAADNPFWKSIEGLLSVGYGASRNLTDQPDHHESLSPEVRSHISLFDPMARLQDAETLIEGISAASPAYHLLNDLLVQVFEPERLSIADHDGSVLSLQQRGALIGAHQLPDGFRSSLAWMADLCGRYAALNPSAAQAKDIKGIVLIDEIDLHLHASLQRAIIPRLRSALPGVQFIVTSHSPLILASFDRNELVLLDNEAEDGVRRSDRQVLGFSADEIYEWLLDTPPSSEAMEAQLEAGLRSRSPGKRERTAELLALNPRRDPEQARASMGELKERIARLKKP
ncbi:MAG: AAA family ATPase [Gammaproteobacteria bacterium]